MFLLLQASEMKDEATLQIILIKNIVSFCVYSSCADRCVSMVTDHKQTLCVV